MAFGGGTECVSQKVVLEEVSLDEDVKVGDPVFFDVEGIDKSPFGQGVVTRVSGGAVMVQPQGRLHPSMKMTNIRKVSAK